MAEDFNIVAGPDEKIGGCPINLQDAAGFLEMMQQANLIDAGYYRNQYTWTNKRIRSSAIAERFDRVLLNSEWISSFVSKIEHLNRTCSDHSPYSSLDNLLHQMPRASGS